MTEDDDQSAGQALTGASLRTIIETVPHYIWRTNPDGSGDYFSERFLKFVGLPMEKVIGWGWFEIIHPDDQAGVQKEWARCRELQIPVSWDFRIQRGETWWWVNSTGNPFFENGTLTKYYGTWTDIQERKENEKRLAFLQNLEARENEKLSLITNALPAFISYVDRNERYQFVNGAYEEWFGVTRDETIGRTALEIQGEETYAITNPYLQRALRGEPVRFEATLKRNGRVRDVVVDYMPHRAPNGEVDGAINVAFDITDRKEIERALRVSEERLQLAIDASALGFWDWDMVAGRVVMSDAMIKMWGLPPTFAQSAFLEANRLIHPDDREMVGQLIEKCRTTGEPYDIEHRVIRPDGSLIWVHGKGQILFNKAGVAIRMTGTSADVTSQRLAQDELKRAKLAADAANEAKTAFLANMSHEIRTPLAAISGFADLLADVISKIPGAENAAISKDYLQRITTNAAQLRSLIDELLDLSKVEANRFELEKRAVNLKQVVDEAFATISLKAHEKGVAFYQRRDSQLPELVLTDENRFRQILLNVLGNAVKFTERGRIKAVLRTFKIDQGEMLEIRVSDTGIGIEPDHHARLFEPFTQADATVSRRFGGTGLGLSLSRRLARLLGGDLELAKSSVGEGSEFVLTLDISQKPTPEQAKIAKPEMSNAVTFDSSKVLHGKKVLVVDDSPDNQRIVSLFIRGAGGETEIASNGKEALEKALAGDYDVVLMDIQMPIMDGFQAMKELSDASFSKPVVALTAHAMREERERCLRAGFTDHLPKPIDRSALLATIAKLASR